jgi:hypothetical protein
MPRSSMAPTKRARRPSCSSSARSSTDLRPSAASGTCRPSTAASPAAGCAWPTSSARSPFSIDLWMTTIQPDHAGQIDIIDDRGEPRDASQLGAAAGRRRRADLQQRLRRRAREIQELGSLDDTAAADYLYRLTSGLDRVSLVDVIREVETARERLLASGRKPAFANSAAAGPPRQAPGRDRRPGPQDAAVERPGCPAPQAD